MKKAICPFKRESEYRRKLDEYLSFCESASPRRLPNAAGFCRYLRIGRREYALAAERFPRMTDVAELSFIDEALNMKAQNSSSTLGYISSMPEAIKGISSEGISVIAEGHSEEDLE